MQYNSALASFVLHLCIMATTGAPSPSMEVVKLSKVKWMAEQLVVKINNNFKQIPVSLTSSPTSEEKYGASSVVMIVNGYNSLISDSFNGAPQVKYEMAALTGFVDQWKSGQCAGRPKPSTPQALAELQGQRQYLHSISFVALYRVKEYLKNLLKNLNQLDTCT